VTAVLVREAELTQRFARYTDDELTQVLAAGLALYTHEELTAAGRELSRRPPPAPSQPPDPQDAPLWPPRAEPLSPKRAEPPAAHTQEPPRPQSPYTFLDLLVDALLCGFGVWAALKVWGWTVAPLPSPWGWIAFYLLSTALLSSMISLRLKWRAKAWRG
jgi:hypothetical protein